MKKAKEIKIIDLLLIISKGKKPPKKIRYDLLEKEYDTLVYDEDEQEYRFENDYSSFWSVPNHHLNDTVEIIEN